MQFCKSKRIPKNLFCISILDVENLIIYIFASKCISTDLFLLTFFLQYAYLTTEKFMYLWHNMRNNHGFPNIVTITEKNAEENYARNCLRGDSIVVIKISQSKIITVCFLQTVSFLVSKETPRKRPEVWSSHIPARRNWIYSCCIL